MTDLTIDEKRIYISKNINLIENHKKILDFVFFYKIVYSENNNGLLVNISKLSDKVIIELYKLIFNIIEKNSDYDYFDKEEIKDYLIIQNSNNEKNDSKILDISLSDFTPKEKEIIKLSKNYKFE